MTIDVDWDVKQQNKQTNKQIMDKLRIVHCVYEGVTGLNLHNKGVCNVES